MQILLGTVDRLAGRWPLLRRKAAERLQLRGQLTLLAKIGDPDGIQRRKISSRVNRLASRTANALDTA